MLSCQYQYSYICCTMLFPNVQNDVLNQYVGKGGERNSTWLTTLACHTLVEVSRFLEHDRFAWLRIGEDYPSSHISRMRVSSKGHVGGEAGTVGLADPA